MEDPKTVAELQEWVEYWVAQVAKSLTHQEVAVVAEIIVAPCDTDEKIPEFIEKFLANTKEWPLNKEGVA